MTGEQSKHESAASDLSGDLLLASPIAMAATDCRYDVIVWNHAAQKLLGHTAQQMLGQPILSLVPQDRRRVFERLLERTCRTGRTTNFEIKFNAPDGQGRQLWVILSPIADPHEPQKNGAAAWIIDQTVSRRMAWRLAQAEKMASLGTLAGGVAHHFNNILGGVATFVDFALTSGDVSAMKRALQITSQAAARAAKITNSLLCFATSDVHRTDLADLTEAVMTFAHLVEKTLADRDIVLDLCLQPGRIFPVETGQINRVLHNLIDNAEEAIPAGGKLTLAVAFDKASATVTVADTGCGIATEDLPQVFEPFFTTKASSAGGEAAHAGLGLCAVHGIIQEMGGRIEVQSQPGKGATFTITFPLPSQT